MGVVRTGYMRGQGVGWGGGGGVCQVPKGSSVDGSRMCKRAVGGGLGGGALGRSGRP